MNPVRSSSSNSSNTAKNTNGAPPSRTALGHAYRPPSQISSSTASCEEWTASKLATASYQDLGGPDDVQGRFMNYLLTSEQCLSSLLHLLRAGTPKSQSSHFSIQINVFELIKVDTVLATMLLRYPNVMLNLLEDAIYKSQTVLLKQIREKTQKDESNSMICHNWTVKGRQHSHDNESFTRVHPRLINLPPHSSCCKSNLHCIVSEDMGRIVQLTGTVVRTSPVRMYEHARQYRCSQKGGCKSQFTIEADLMQTNNALNVPTCCPGIIPPGHQDNNVDDDDDNDDENNNRGPASRMAGANRGRGGGRGRGRGGYYNKHFGFKKGASVKKRPGDPCRGTKLDIVKSFHTDYQEIKIQESASQMGSSTTTNGGNILPRSFIVKVEDDLVDLCKPGDDIVVVGSLIPQWQPTLANIQVDIGVAIRAHSIRVLNSSSSSSHNDGITLQDRSTKEKLQYEFEQIWKFKDKEKQPHTKDADDYWRSIATRNFICRSICPKLYGLRTIKLALLLTLIGGVSNVDTTSGVDCTLMDDKQVETNESKNNDDENYMNNNNNGTTSNSQNDQDNEQHDSFLSAEIAVPEQFSLFGGGDSSSSNGTKKDNAITPSQQQQRQSSLNNFNSNSEASATASFSHQDNKNNSGSIQSRRREQCHLLLVGDPGTGKSQLLRFAAALSPRSVLTTGVGTTSAGLTCAAVRDGGSSGKGSSSDKGGGGGSGDFVLEAGALVLADRGVCCIDEFSCIQTHDRTTIHEAMEQQTLSVAKAGMVCKLNCRTTIVAASNPKGNLYEIEKSLMDNTGIGAPLLSRFDLIFKMVDSSDFHRDERIATHLLNDAIRGGGGNTFLSTFHEHANHPDSSSGRTDDHADMDEQTKNDRRHNDRENYQSQKKRRRVLNTDINNTTKELWNIDKLRAYIANVKSRFRPTFTSEAATLLQTHYEQCRLKASTNNTMHTTVRMFESLIRLSQAHARLMYRPIVTLQDAAAVVLLMERSAYTKGGFNPTFVEDSEFYKDPMTADDDEDDNDEDDNHFDNDPHSTGRRTKSRADRLFDEEQKALLLSYGLYDLIPPSDEDEENEVATTSHFGGNYSNHRITLNNASYNSREHPVNNNNHVGNGNNAQLWNSYHQEQQQHQNQQDKNHKSRYRMGDDRYNQHQSSSSSVLTPQNYLNQNNEHLLREPLSMVTTAQTTIAATTQSFTQHTDCYGRQHLTPLPKKKSSSSSKEKHFS